MANLHIQTSFCNQQITLLSNGNLVTHLLRKMTSVKDPPIIYELQALSDFLTGVNETAGGINYQKSRTESFEDAVTRYQTSCKRECTPMKLTICWSRHLALMKYDNHWYLSPSDSILLQNKCADFISVYWYTCLRGCLLPPNAVQIYSDFLRSLCEIKFMYRNKAYTVFKTLEAFGIGESLVEQEQLPNSGVLQQRYSQEKPREGWDHLALDYLGSLVVDTRKNGRG